MATTQNTYTGDGSTTNYSFTFEYIKQADVKVTLDAVATTAFTFANATTLSMNTAPTSGAAIRIYRDTDIDVLNATFFPGSAIKAEDLNSNFTQTHFATQETDNEVGASNVIATAAKTTADTALTNSAAAVTSANAAVTTANTADTNAAAAVVTANAASAAASLAVSFSLVTNVAAIPTNPADQDRIEIGDSTGLGSFTPLTGVPSGFVGNSGLTVRLEYDLTNTTWLWMNYFANNSEDRYVSKEYTSANMPTGSTAERPSTPAAGMLRFNSTEVEFEGYDGFAWGAIGGGLVTIDAGNFNTGGTLVTTEEIYDGGSFD